MKRFLVCMVSILAVLLNSSTGIFAQAGEDDILYYGMGFEWSPDGARVVFWYSLEDGINNVVLADFDGRNPELLVQLDTYIGRAIWSPDGKRLILEGFSTDYVYDLETEVLTTLVEYAVVSGYPWGPDSKKILVIKRSHYYDHIGGDPYPMEFYDLDNSMTNIKIEGAVLAYWDHKNDQIFTVEGVELSRVDPHTGRKSFVAELQFSDEYSKCALSRDSSMLICGSGGDLTVWDTSSLDILYEPILHSKGVFTHVTMSWDNTKVLKIRRIGGCCENHWYLSVLDVDSRKTLFQLDGKINDFPFMSWHPSGGLLLSYPNADAEGVYEHWLLSVETGEMAPWPSLD